MTPPRYARALLLHLRRFDKSYASAHGARYARDAAARATRIFFFFPAYAILCVEVDGAFRHGYVCRFAATDYFLLHAATLSLLIHAMPLLFFFFFFFFFFFLCHAAVALPDTLLRFLRLRCC